MQPRVVRAASSSSVIWAGAVVIFFGVMTSLCSVALIMRAELLGAVPVVLFGALVIAAGAALILRARRASGRLDAPGVAWSTMLGGRGFVPWEQVHQVVVPGMHERGDAVLLWLRDGSVVPIESLRTTQAPDDATGVHPWYARAGESVVRAHQQWLAQHGVTGR